MKAINLLSLSAFVIITASLNSCNSSPKEKSNECKNSSFEFVRMSRDTVNRIDCRGKQGIWVPSPSNNLKDTTYYRNDTVIG